jgi:hypothetical protein
VVSNVQGRHRNRGLSQSESTQYSNSTSVSTGVGFSNTATHNFSDNFSYSKECVDRTVISE